MVNNIKFKVSFGYHFDEPKYDAEAIHVSENVITQHHLYAEMELEITDPDYR